MPRQFSGSASGEGRPAVIAPVFLAVAIGVLVVLRGGFDDAPMCVAGALAAILAVIPMVRRACADAGGAALLAALGCLALAGGLASGLSLTMVAEAARWFAAAAFALIAASVSASSRRRVLDAFCLVAVLSALVGSLTLADWFPLYGGRAGGRMEFPFEYANASAVAYAVAAVLCLGSEDRRLRALAVVAAFGLLLTRSVGGMAVFALGFIAQVALLGRAGALGRAYAALAAFAVAAALFAVTVALGPASAFPAACIATGAGLAASTRLDAVQRAMEARMPASRAVPPACAAALVVLGIAFCALALPDRVHQAAQTLIERLVQVQDAAGLLAASPLWGIGPGSWAMRYPVVQSAQYQAALVHSSYVQVALDAGLAGLALFAAFAVRGVAALARARDFNALVAAGMLLAHAALDFDFSFFAVLALLVVLLRGAGELPAPTARHRAPAAAHVGVAALSFALCALGTASAVTLGVAHGAGIAGDGPYLDQLSATSALARRDESVQTSRYAALVQYAAPVAAVELRAEVGVETAEQALLCSAALMRAGEADLAGEVIVSELVREPYNVELFEQAAALFEANGVPASVADAYADAVQRANRLAGEGNAALLDNQVRDLPQAKR